MKKYIEPQMRLSRFENESIATDPSSGGYTSYDSWQKGTSAKTNNLSITKDFNEITTAFMNE